MIDCRHDAERSLLVAEAYGEVTRTDYETRLLPAVEAAMARGPVRMLYWFGPEFSGFSAGALWSDMRLGLTHLSAFSRLALVTDEAPMSGLVQGFAWMMPIPVRTFTNDAIGDANRWLLAQ